MSSHDVYQRSHEGCFQAQVGEGECALNAEDRQIVEGIDKNTREITKVLRALSVSLIGRVNGEEVDPEGGRIGRMEEEVKELFRWRWGTTVALIVILLGMLGYFIRTMIELHH